jgi:hypothetical protein
MTNLRWPLVDDDTFLRLLDEHRGDPEGLKRVLDAEEQRRRDQRQRYRRPEPKTP